MRYEIRLGMNFATKIMNKKNKKSIKADFFLLSEPTFSYANAGENVGEQNLATLHQAA